MAENKTPIATDSAEELRGLIGDDASATFESDPNFVNSNPTESASSDNIALRDTDDTEDSEEEDEEADEDEDVDEDDVDEEDDDEVDEDDEDEDDEEEGDEEDEDLDEDEDDEDEVLRTAEPVDVHGSLKHSKEDIEKELEEMEEEDSEDEGVETPVGEDEDHDDGEAGVHAERAIDEALRLSATDIANQSY